MNRNAAQFAVDMASGKRVQVEIDCHGVCERLVYRADQVEALGPNSLVRPHFLTETEAEWWLDRAEAFTNEYDRMQQTEDRLAIKAIEFGERCELWDDRSCNCSLCNTDGPVGMTIGNLGTHWIFDRRDYAEVYVQHTSRPRRGPTVFRYASEGMVPQDRGHRRVEALESIERLIEGGVAQTQRGRPTGSGGIDWESIVNQVDLQAAAGITKQECFESLAELTNYPIETIKRGYFRYRSKLRAAQK